MVSHVTWILDMWHVQQDFEVVGSGLRYQKHTSFDYLTLAGSPFDPEQMVDWVQLQS